MGVVSRELSRHCQALLEELQNDRLGAEASGGWGLKARGPSSRASGSHGTVFCLCHAEPRATWAQCPQDR